MTRPPQHPEEVLEKFILGFEGRALPEELRGYLGAGLGGLILFPRNFSSAEEFRTLTSEIHRAAGRPVLVGIDQEGGTRFSLPEPFTQWASPEELGRLDNPEIVEEQARSLARELSAVGCNLDFAPMLDLHLQPESPVTKGRSFGGDPNKVARLGAAFARGLRAGGILACAKHFPGHGDAVVDPHQDLPLFQGSLDRLRDTELLPFARAISANVPMIMTAHISLPGVDPEWPASLSLRVLGNLLRDEMRYEGIILADDLGMSAIVKRWRPADAAVRTFLAGSDMALICHDWGQVRPAIEGVAKARAAAQFGDRQLAESHERIAALRKQVELQSEAPPLSVIGCAEHRELVRKIRARIEELRAAS